MPHKVLDQIEVFQGLPESACQTLLEAGEVKSYPANTVILKEREQLNCLYIILEGHVEAYLPKTEQRISAVRLSEMGPGDCFAEYAFIDQQPASASIRALTDARVLCLEYATLRSLFEADAALASLVYNNLLVILVQRLRASVAELDLFTLAF
jgi:CRP-like cAMP-binding protein